MPLLNASHSSDWSRLSTWFLKLYHLWLFAITIPNAQLSTAIWKCTYLIKSSRLRSFSVMSFDGLAAISHSNFGRHASRILLANVILSFKSICSNLVFVLDFFAINSSMSCVDGESTEWKPFFFFWFWNHWGISSEENKHMKCV